MQDFPVREWTANARCQGNAGRLDRKTMQSLLICLNTSGYTLVTFHPITFLGLNLHSPGSVSADSVSAVVAGSPGRFQNIVRSSPHESFVRFRLD
jgi:hypothetical protein